MVCLRHCKECNAYQILDTNGVCRWCREKVDLRNRITELEDENNRLKCCGNCEHLIESDWLKKHGFDWDFGCGEDFDGYSLECIDYVSSLRERCPKWQQSPLGNVGEV